jgi:hypothetical protein
VGSDKDETVRVERRIGKEWVDANNTETTEDFLERSEPFLQKGAKGEKWGVKIRGLA